MNGNTSAATAASNAQAAQNANSIAAANAANTKAGIPSNAAANIISGIAPSPSPNAQPNPPVAAPTSISPTTPTTPSPSVPTTNSSSTVVSNSNILDNVIPSNAQIASNLSNANLTTNQEGFAVYGDSSYASAPSDATQITLPSGQQAWTSGGVNYALGPATSINPIEQSNLDEINRQIATNDQTTASQIQGIQQEYQGILSDAKASNENQQQEETALMLRAGAAKSSIAGGVINGVVQNGLLKIADLTNKENSLISQINIAGQQEDFKLQDQLITEQQNIYDQKQKAAQDRADKVSTYNSQQNALKQTAATQRNIASIISSGVTDPNQILAQLEKNGDTTTSVKDVTDVIAGLNPNEATLYDIMKSAAANGAPANILQAIGSSKSVEDGLTAAGQYMQTQDKTGVVGEYQFYVKQAQAAGQTPMSFTNYQTFQANLKNVVAPPNSGTAPGTTGSSSIVTTTPGYYTQIVSGTGGLTQAFLDQAALSYALTATLPGGSRSMTGIAGEQNAAIKARAAELDSGGNMQANKAQLAALSSALKEQTDTVNSVQQAVNAAEKGSQQLVTTYGGKINNDIPIANAIENFVTYNLNASDVAAMKAGLQEISNDYTQVFGRGGGMTNQQQTTANDILDGNMSMSELKSVMTELQAQGKTVIDSGNDQISQIQGQINGIIGGADTSNTAPTQAVQSQQADTTTLQTYIKNNPTQSDTITSQIQSMEKTLGRSVSATEFLQAFPEYANATTTPAAPATQTSNPAPNLGNGTAPNPFNYKAPAPFTYTAPK